MNNDQNSSPARSNSTSMTPGRPATIVIADPERRRWDLLLRGDPPREIARRTGIPVHAVRVREAPPS